MGVAEPVALLQLLIVALPAVVVPARIRVRGSAVAQRVGVEVLALHPLGGVEGGLHSVGLPIGPVAVSSESASLLLSAIASSALKACQV